MYEISDIFKDLGSNQNVSVVFPKFKEYKTIDITDSKQHEQYIGTYVYGVIDTETKDLHINYDDYGILLSLINLVNDTLPKDNAISEIFMDFINKDLLKIDKIIEWCGLYGLPYIDTFLRESTTCGLYGFKVSNFRQRAITLYYLFRLWRAFSLNDSTGIQKYSLAPNVNGVQQEISMFVSSFANARLTLKYNENENSFVFQPVAESLFDVAFYQLMCLIVNPETIGNLKPCANCGNWFQGRKNQKFCGKTITGCDRRYVFKKKNNKKKNKKEDENNGGKEEKKTKKQR